MKRRLVLAAGGTAVGAALLVSGCGGSGSEVRTDTMKLTAAEALARTSQKTGQADTFKADLTVTDNGEGGVRVKATGRFRLRPEPAASIRLTEASRGGRTIPEATGQAIFIGDVLYVKVPRGAQSLTGGRPWGKVDMDQAGSRLGVDVGELVDQADKVNPAEQTRMFTASKDVRRVGTETVDGVETTRYTGTTTVREALDRLDPAAREKARRWFPQATGNERITFDLWVGKDYLPRKLRSRTTGGNGDRGGSVTILYSDYAKPFTVSPPPADQVGEISLTNLFGGRRPAPPRN